MALLIAPLKAIAHTAESVQGVGGSTNGNRTVSNPREIAYAQQQMVKAFLQLSPEQKAEQFARLAVNLVGPTKLAQCAGFNKGMGAVGKILKRQVSTLGQATKAVKAGEEIAVAETGITMSADMAKECERLAKSPPKAEIVRDGGLPLTQSAASKAVSVASETISLSGHDASLGDLKKLEEAANMFKTNVSAIAKDGPLTKLLENGKAGSSVGSFGCARGAAYELKKAHDLAKSGEEVLGFGRKIGGREFDIETATKLIECKNIDWSTKVGEVANNMKGIFCDQAKKAQSIGKTFEVHSKNGVTSNWIKWFESKGIKVVEG